MLSKIGKFAVKTKYQCKMNIKIGDRVRLLDDVEEGVVTNIIDKKMVNIKTLDGFEMPVMRDQLVLANPDGDYKPREEVSTGVPVDVPTPGAAPDFQEEGFFEPDPEVNYILAITCPSSDFRLSNLAFYLINDSNYQSFYYMGLKNHQKCRYLSSGYLEANTKIRLDKIYAEDFFQNDAIVLQVLLFNTNEFKEQRPVQKSVNTKNLTVLKARDLKENDYFDEKAYIVQLFKEEELQELKSLSKQELEKMLAEKFQGGQEVKKEKPKKEKQQNQIEEVDLHIHEIVDDFSEMSNGEIVRVQMDRFRTSLETARIHGTKRMVFIHGVGDGKLKYELRKELDEKFPELSYQDASFKEYGYGATMVILKK